MALFIKFDGVDGEAKDKDHKSWSDLLSMSWGVHKAGGGATGQTRRRGVATVDDVVITKELDKSSPKLAEAVLSGKVFPKVEIHNTATYGEGRATFLKYELKNVAITSHSISARRRRRRRSPRANVAELRRGQEDLYRIRREGHQEGQRGNGLEGRGRLEVSRSRSRRVRGRRSFDPDLSTWLTL